MAPAPVRIRWTPQADDDLQSVHGLVTETSIRLADALVDRMLSEIDVLERFPHLGRRGRIRGTRELVITHTPYIVAYRLIHEHVEILGVSHGARKWPGSF